MFRQQLWISRRLLLWLPGQQPGGGAAGECPAPHLPLPAHRGDGQRGRDPAAALPGGQPPGIRPPLEARRADPRHRGLCQNRGMGFRVGWEWGGFIINKGVKFIRINIHTDDTSLRMRSSLAWMRSSRVVRASDCQCTSCNGPGFNPSIRRHSGIWGAADEAVLNIVRKKNKKSPPKIYFKKV